MAEKWGSKRRRSLVMLHPQSGSKGHKCFCSNSLPFSVWSRTPVHGRVPPTFTFHISIQSLTDKLTVFLCGDYYASKLKIKTNFHIRFDLWPLESCPSKVANLSRGWPTVSDWMVWKDNNWPVSLSQPSFTIFPKKWIQNANIKSGMKRSRLYTENESSKLKKKSKAAKCLVHQGMMCEYTDRVSGKKSAETSSASLLVQTPTLRSKDAMEWTCAQHRAQWSTETLKNTDCISFSVHSSPPMMFQAKWSSSHSIIHIIMAQTSLFLQPLWRPDHKILTESDKGLK